MLAPNCLFLLCWCQIVCFLILVPNILFAFLVPNCPFLLWCQIVRVPNCPTPPYLVRNNTIDRFDSFIVTFRMWQCFDKLKYWVGERWIVTFANVRVWISLWLNWMCKATYWEGKLNGEILIISYEKLFFCNHEFEKLHTVNMIISIEFKPWHECTSSTLCTRLSVECSLCPALAE